MDVLAKRLKWLREKKRLSQKEVAAEIGMKTVNGYQKLESGERNPKLEVLVKLADMFDISVDFLLGRSDVTSDLKEIPMKVKKLKDRVDKLQEKSTEMLSIISELRDQMMKIAKIEGFASDSTVVKADILDSVINQKLELDSVVTSLLKEIGNLVYHYLIEILDIPFAKPAKNEFLKEYYPFDIEIKKDSSDEYILMIHGKGLGMIAIHDTFKTESEALESKNMLMRRLGIPLSQEIIDTFEKWRTGNI